MDPAIKEWLCAREVCRRLGFTPDEIFFAVQAGGIVVEEGIPFDFGDQPVIAVELHRGDRTFVWTIGPVQLAVDAIQPAFEAASAAWNAGNLSDADFFASKAFSVAVPLVVALQAKGFEVNRG